MQPAANSKTTPFKTLPSSGAMGGAHELTAAVSWRAKYETPVFDKLQKSFAFPQCSQQSNNNFFFYQEPKVFECSEHLQIGKYKDR